jgi:hypothetical protein
MRTPSTADAVNRLLIPALYAVLEKKAFAKANSIVKERGRCTLVFHHQRRTVIDAKRRHWWHRFHPDYKFYRGLRFGFFDNIRAITGLITVVAMLAEALRLILLMEDQQRRQNGHSKN